MTLLAAIGWLAVGAVFMALGGAIVLPIARLSGARFEGRRRLVLGILVAAVALGLWYCFPRIVSAIYWSV